MDAIEAYWLTAKKGKIGEIYNTGGKKVILVKILNTLIKVAQKKFIVSMIKNYLGLRI